MIYNAENFPELPRSWASLTVDNSVDSAGNSNKKLKSKDALDHGRFPVIDQGQSDISGYSDDESLVVEASESNPVILFGDHTRFLKKISQPFVPGADGTKLFRAKSFWDARFVYQMLRAIKLPDKGYARHFQYLRDSVLPLPPLNEQKRIADKLDAVLARVDACRDRLDRVPLILKRFRQSVLAATTSGKLTEEWREESTISDEWHQVQLGDVARDLSYGSSAKSSKSGPVPVLRMGNIQDGRLDWSDLVYTSDSKEIAKYRLASGDVLFNRTNSPELVGKTAVFKSEREAVYAGYLIRVRCSSQLLPDYLNYCLGSPAGRDYCWQVKSDGVSQSNINAKKLAAFGFLLPSVEEQTEIVRRVEALFAYADRLAARYTAARAQVEKLTPALLAKAFRGELVPQDPNDEPASVLLERIRTECGRQVTNQPKRVSRKPG